jgi:hypothetical protein
MRLLARPRSSWNWAVFDAHAMGAKFGDGLVYAFFDRSPLPCANPSGPYRGDFRRRTVRPSQTIGIGRSRTFKIGR